LTPRPVPRLRRSLAGENIRMALGTLWSQKMRSGLTLLGIIIGVATVIAMVSLIQGLNRSIVKQIGSLGTGVLYISKHEPGIQIGDDHERRRPRKDLTRGDAEAIAELCPAVAYVSPQIMDKRKVAFAGTESRSVDIVGGNESFFPANNWTIERGRGITYDDVRHAAPVCVVGADIVNLLFPTGGELGSLIQIGNLRCRVIGVLGARGQMFGQKQDEIVVVPLVLLSRSMGYGESVDFIVAAARDPALAQVAKEQIEELLRRRRGVRADQENDFGVTSQENLLKIYDQVTRGFYLVMVLISSIGLMVGGIGVMNMMLVSVRERTREIGLRMAVGCRRRDLLGQFLVEASVLTGSGGVIGIIVGQLLALLLSLVLPIPSAVSIAWVLIAVAVSASIGLFFGMYPAWRASRLDPVDALRWE
jgi:putative ABC transport system permease protein